MKFSHFFIRRPIFAGVLSMVIFLVGLIEDRFPGRERRERIPVPDGVLKETLPGRENFLQEERRLFYVAMTRARRALYMTWARDYGTKRFKMVSPFVLEALDIPKMPEDVLKASVLEEIRRYALATARPRTAAAVRARRRNGGNSPASAEVETESGDQSLTYSSCTSSSTLPKSTPSWWKKSMRMASFFSSSVRGFLGFASTE